MLVYSHREDIDQTPALAFTAMPQPNSSNQDSFNLYTFLPSITRYREHLLSDPKGSHSIWKTCEHYKCSQVQGSGSKSVRVSLDSFGNGETHIAELSEPLALYDNTYGNAGEFNSGLPSFFVPQDGGSFVPPPPDLDLLLQHGLAAMMPKIKAELSIVNSLIELKDFLTLRSTIESAKKSFEKLANGKIPFKKTLSDVFRSKADVYLQYKFNIAPLISDISGIFRSLARTERRINAFITRSGRVRISHYSRFLTESIDPDPQRENGSGFQAFQPEGPVYPLRTYTRMDRFVETEPASFHVQVQYNYNYTAYQVEHARILALLDALGISNDPSIIWNAIPWSFVVDWVFGVGRYLDSMKVGNMDPKINILRCLWSIRRKRRIQITGHTATESVYFPYAEFPPTSLAFPVVVESAYRRNVFLPGRSLIESSGLSSTEFSLGAALIISQRRRPKRLRR